MAESKPILAITMGDPAGIGPETIVSALSDERIYHVCEPVVVGRPVVLQRAADLLKLPLEVQVVTDPAMATSASRKVLCCLESGSPEADDLAPAIVDARGGQAAYDALVMAAELARGGKVAGIVTAPLHKVALNAAGHLWPGHTELLAELCGVERFAMMLYLPPGGKNRGGPAGLGVIHVTLHMALREVFEHLTHEAICEKIELAYKSFTKIRGALHLPREPRIGVAALNPHGGEGGLFGDEEERLIAPAVRWAQRRGWHVEGPFPTDTLMYRAAEGEFDAVVAMYHDQGHIALKLLDMFEAVNITLGLPIVRTSVAHGTAFDLAWKGKAKSGGMVQAILTAARLVRGL
jgi:4-hydroxythreonine-4-phosphate dehydrogenase